MITLPERRAAAHVSTPLGQMVVVAGPRGVSALHFGTGEPGVPLDPRALRDVTDSVQAYFEDPTVVEQLPLDLDPPDACTSDFATAVRRALLEVPVGSTTTYGELARCVGRPGAARAVGRAVGANPVAIVVPCHRVVRADGTVGGYAWGTERKVALLDLEQRHHTRGVPT